MLLPLLALCCSAGEARAEVWRAPSNLAMDLALDLRYTRFDAPAAGVERADSLIAGLSIAAIAARRSIGFAIALDAHLGAGLNGGFAYDVALHPLGLGIALGHTARLRTTVGIGTQGLTGQIPVAVRVPVRAALHLELGRRVHLAGWAEVAFIGAADGRQNGSTRAPFGDELNLGGYVRVGKGGRDYRSQWGNGYLVGAAYREMLGERQIMVMLGYGIGATAQP